MTDSAVWFQRLESAGWHCILRGVDGIRGRPYDNRAVDCSQRDRRVSGRECCALEGLRSLGDNARHRGRLRLAAREPQSHFLEKRRVRLRHKLSFTVALGFAVTISQAALAQAAGTHRCAAIADGSARLACYDAAYGSPAAPQGAEAHPAAPATAATPDPTYAPAQSSEEFGFAAAHMQAKAPKKPESGPERIRVSVTALRRQPTGEFIATFDNGQTWVQSEINSRAGLEVGDTVTIHKAAFGSFLLVTTDRLATRVRRIR
jgi:hypothetical protein